MRKILTVLASLVFLIGISAGPISAVSETPHIETFTRDDCPHCRDQEAFFEELQQNMPELTVTYHDVYQPEAQELFIKVTDKFQLNMATPTTLIGNQIIQGFSTPETTGVQIQSLLDSQDQFYSFEEIVRLDANTIQSGETCLTDCTDEPLLVNAPILGAIDVRPYSLPIMSLILGFIDGFNPCAMWVLVTFLMILVQVGDRRKMWTFAGLFIVAEAIMYYLILTVWFTTWDFIGLNRIVTPIVSLLAIGSGIYFLNSYRTYDGTCKVTNLEQQKKTRNRIQDLVAKPLNLATALGIIGLALSVNIIEFACSIGIPQTFTKILELNGLSWAGSLGYMGLYILAYMIDDFIVFGIALYSFEKIGLTSKYARFSNLIGGILMIALGFILLFRPEILVF